MKEDEKRGKVVSRAQDQRSDLFAVIALQSRAELTEGDGYQGWRSEWYAGQQIAFVFADTHALKLLELKRNVEIERSINGKKVDLENF